MSDEQGRPLTRRELREREGWIAQDAESAPEGAPNTADAQPERIVEENVLPATTSSVPVIGADGRILSRRELRALWEAEAAALAAEQVQAAESAAQEVEELQASEPVAEPIESSAQDAEDELELDTAADIDTDVVDEETSEHPPVNAPSQKGFRFPWSKPKSGDDESEKTDTSAPEQDSSEHAGNGGGVVEVAAAAVSVAAVAEVVSTDELAEEADEDTPEDAPERDDAAAQTAEVAEVAEPDEDAEVVDEAEAKPEVEPYSFPEVSPDPESRSIFQTTGTVPYTPTVDLDGNESDPFDDIITRAVADEGAASPTNTSALILPVLPDTTDLTGALNETGEIVITGSIELPKILGETGGHADLHDALDMHEAAVLGHDVHEVVLEPETGTQPVSAARAVSAQASQNAIVSANPKSDSKLPLILAISAGGLLVVVSGVFVWAASTGLFG